MNNNSRQRRGSCAADIRRARADGADATGPFARAGKVVTSGSEMLECQVVVALRRVAGGRASGLDAGGMARATASVSCSFGSVLRPAAGRQLPNENASGCCMRRRMRGGRRRELRCGGSEMRRAESIAWFAMCQIACIGRYQERKFGVKLFLII